MCLTGSKQPAVKKTPPPVPDPIETNDAIESPLTIRKNQEAAMRGGRSALRVKRASVNSPTGAGVNPT